MSFSFPEKRMSTLSGLNVNLEEFEELKDGGNKIGKPKLLKNKVKWR